MQYRFYPTSLFLVNVLPFHYCFTDGFFLPPRPELRTQHSALCTQHSALSTLHSGLCTEHSGLCTQDCLHPSADGLITPNPPPCASHSGGWPDIRRILSVRVVSSVVSTGTPHTSHWGKHIDWGNKSPRTLSSKLYRRSVQETFFEVAFTA